LLQTVVNGMILTFHDYFDPTVINEFASGPWSKRFFTELRKHPRQRESLSILEGAGVNLNILLHFLYQYSHPSSVAVARSARKGARLISKDLTDLQQAMCQLAQKLQSASHVFTFHSYMTHDFPTPRGLQVAAEAVREIRDQYKRESSQKGRGRDEELLTTACLLVQLQTHSKHWEDLADLLELVFYVNGQHAQFDKDSLRKIVQRFRQSDPESYHGTRELLATYCTPIATQNVVRRSTRNRRSARTKSAPLVHGARGLKAPSTRELIASLR